MTVTERVEALRAQMKAAGISAYVIPSADFHQSEYVGDHFKAREFISGFDGSAGTVVVTPEDARLWTDGRYFIQAAHQLAGSGISLMKMGTPGFPAVTEFLVTVLHDGDTLGFDGRLISMGEGLEFEEALAGKNVTIDYEKDLVDAVWKGRPPLANEKAWLHEEKYAGESTASKVARVRAEMKKRGATSHVITSLDDIGWLFNIRGNDVAYSPLVLGYAFLTEDRAYLFVDADKLNSAILANLGTVGTEVKPYNGIYEFIKTLSAEEKLLVDTMKINYAIYNNIPPGVTKIKAPNPSSLMKAMKNEVEARGMRSAQQKDAVAFAKFMYWLKTAVGKEDITEISAEKKLDEFRAGQEGFMGPSFEPISAYGDHAAIVHYAPTLEEQYTLKAEGLYLSDTGGNYPEGTTDITRTFVLGTVTAEMKKHFTAVARSMIGLSRAKFLRGCRGYNLDILARLPMWELGIDYKHGTGHGVGNLLNIHEGPTGFRWNIVPAKNETTPFEEGMYITDEPGIYIEGSHGIRLENELLVRKFAQSGDDTFLEFETMTFVPIDLDGIIPEDLTGPERDFLNSYHAEVFARVSPYLSVEEAAWLRDYTKPV
ncbi:Xaa-Pro aminopeptidase [Spirochaetia bacterium]|nr:Xaa-Pro aminopeptidase [Spirochaetia bacterium]